MRAGLRFRPIPAHMFRYPLHLKTYKCERGFQRAAPHDGRARPAKPANRREQLRSRFDIPRY